MCAEDGYRQGISLWVQARDQFISSGSGQEVKSGKISVVLQTQRENTCRVKASSSQRVCLPHEISVLLSL